MHSIFTPKAESCRYAYLPIDFLLATSLNSAISGKLIWILKMRSICSFIALEQIKWLVTNFVSALSLQTFFHVYSCICNVHVVISFFMLATIWLILLNCVLLSTSKVHKLKMLKDCNKVHFFKTGNISIR